MATKTIELDYTPELNRKIIHKAGVPGDNLPDNLMQFMCKHYDNNNIIEGKRILVIRMLDLAKQYAVKNSVTYITDNPEKYDEFLKAINNEQKYGGDDSVELIEDWKNIGELLKDMPKFDVVIGNPPYEGKGNPLYLQILEKVNTGKNTVVWICPTQWVKNYKDSNFLKNLKKNTCNNLISHTFIGNPFENASLANEVGIFVFGEGNKENYETIKMERFLNAKLAKSIWDKFNNWNKNFGSIDKHNKIDLNKKYYVRAQWIRGNVHESKPCWDWTTLFGTDQRTNFSFKPVETNSSPVSYWNFSSTEECKNFIASTETDILMFAHYISKINNANNNQVLDIIPWFGDYTHEWTEEAIAKELNLTQEEVNYIHEEMKEFGWKAAPKKKSK